MKTFLGVVVGAFAGFCFALCIGGRIEALIWPSQDMEGKGYFTVLCLAPLCTVLGAVVVGWMWRHAGTGGGGKDEQ